MRELRDVAALCQHLGELPKPLLVAIEGFMSSGKSSLADALGAELDATVVHTDNFVVPGDESLPYPERLNYELLAASLRGASATLIEGICLRQVLGRLNAVPTTFVYVKRISSNGLWHDRFHLEEYEEEEEENVQSVITEPEKSDLNYHASVRPHEHANIVFQRVEA